MIMPQQCGAGTSEGGHSKGAEDGVTKKLRVVAACYNSNKDD